MRTGLRAAVAACLVAMATSALTACVAENDVEEEGYTPLYSTSDEGGITGDGAPSPAPMLVRIDSSESSVIQQTPGQGVGVFTQYVGTSKDHPGGHWYVWWTCDTSLSSEPCNFDIRATVEHGTITNGRSQNFAPGDSLTGGGNPAATNGDGGDDAGSRADAGGTKGTAPSEAGAHDAGADGSASDAALFHDAGDDDRGGAASKTITAETYTTTQLQGMYFDTDPGATINLSATLGGEYSGSFLFFLQNDQVNGGYTGPVTDPLDLQASTP